MAKIGISIPWDYLSGNFLTEDATIIAQYFESPEAFLAFIMDLNVTHIELRNRQPDISPKEMKVVFALLRDRNLQITIHGDNLPPGSIWTIHDIFPWLGSLNREDYIFSNHLVITLHSYRGQGSLSDLKMKTINFIKNLSDQITELQLPINLALENQRSKGYIDPGTSYIGVVNMCQEINRNNVGICWDMGHCFANYVQDSQTFPIHPPTEFLKSTTHTHIHDLGPDGKTHWFFKENKVPLPEYVKNLKAIGYNGIYNLELSFDRFAKEENIPELIIDSIIKLKKLI
jgi:sugar phosphate isomerase/epimerase